MNLSDKIFKGAEVSEKDHQMYRKILKGNTENREAKVIEHFMATYIYPLNGKFQKTIETVLLDSLTGELSEMQATKNIIGFQSVGKSYIAALTRSYTTVTDMCLGSFFDRYNIKSAEMKKALRNEVYQQFNALTKTTMTQTEADILKHVRILQRESIQRNLHVEKLKQMNVLDDVIEREIKLFKDNMLKKYPELEKALKNGQVLKSRGWIDKQTGAIKYRTFTLDEYAELQAETIKNMASKCSEIDAIQSGERVVEFVLIDNRKLKTEPNKTCMEILSKRIKGKSILALDESAAKILGIWTVDQAKANGSMRISHHCRHGLKRIEDKAYLNMINKILYVASIGSERTGETDPEIRDAEFNSRVQNRQADKEFQDQINNERA